MGIWMGLGAAAVVMYSPAACSEDRALLRSNPSAEAGGKMDGAGPLGPASSCVHPGHGSHAFHDVSSEELASSPAVNAGGLM